VVAPIVPATIAHRKSVAASRVVAANVTARAAARTGRAHDVVLITVPVRAVNVQKVEPAHAQIASAIKVDHALATVVRARQVRLRQPPAAARVLYKRMSLDDLTSFQ